MALLEMEQKPFGVKFRCKRMEELDGDISGMSVFPVVSFLPQHSRFGGDDYLPHRQFVFGGMAVGFQSVAIFLSVFAIWRITQ